METKNTLKQLPMSILFGLIFILPIIVLPYLPISFAFTKSSIVFLISALLFLMFSVNALKEGKLFLPKSWSLLIFGALIIVYLLSSVFSDSIFTSLIGYGFEAETFFAISMF